MNRRWLSATYGSNAAALVEPLAEQVSLHQAGSTGVFMVRRKTVIEIFKNDRAVVTPRTTPQAAHEALLLQSVKASISLPQPQPRLAGQCLNGHLRGRLASGRRTSKVLWWSASNRSQQSDHAPVSVIDLEADWRPDFGEKPARVLLRFDAPHRHESDDGPGPTLIARSLAAIVACGTWCAARTA